MCALVYSTKDIDMVLFDRPPESISNILERSGSWSAQVEWKDRKKGGGKGEMVSLRVNIALAQKEKNLFFFYVFISFRGVCSNRSMSENRSLEEIPKR